MSAAPLLEVAGLCKSYSAPVLTDVDFGLRAGEVHALLGANGAGKSTLVKIISGLTPANSGRLAFRGNSYAPQQKADAEQTGIQIVQQELNLIPTLSVAENLFLNRLPRRFGVVDRRTLLAQARAALASVNLQEVEPTTPVDRLGIGQRQLVEIAAALSRPCNVLILDEPTAALTDPQIDRLFAHIRRLKAEGVGIIYISHRMEELRKIADRATILRDGRVVLTAPMEELTSEKIVQSMVGKEVQAEAEHPVRSAGDIRLKVERLSAGKMVNDVSFAARAGEILGIAGLVGSGRTELLRAIFGVDRAEKGRITVGANAASRPFRHPREAVAAGLAMIPEDRQQQGLLLERSIRVNVTLGKLSRFAGWLGRLDWRAETRATAESCDHLSVNCQGWEQTAGALSGGNQQKVVMARWLLKDADVFLFDEPTRGIDVAAKANVYRWLNELAVAGKAVVVVSSDLSELLSLCDRIGVISAGRWVATFPRDDWSQEKILHAAFSGYQ